VPVHTRTAPRAEQRRSRQTLRAIAHRNIFQRRNAEARRLRMGLKLPTLDAGRAQCVSICHRRVGPVCVLPSVKRNGSRGGLLRRVLGIELADQKSEIWSVFPNRASARCPLPRHRSVGSRPPPHLQQPRCPRFWQSHSTASSPHGPPCNASQLVQTYLGCRRAPRPDAWVANVPAMSAPPRRRP
jgi:hypothetical protein